MLLALDPGRNFCGYAYGDKVLRGCGVSKLPPAGKIWSLAQVCQFHGDALNSVGVTRYRYERVVVERMGLRMQDAQGKTATAKMGRIVAIGNDLLGLQAIGAFIAGRVGGTLEYVQHFQCSKEVTQNRVLHLLSPAEQDVLALYGGKKRDDICDAVAHWLRAVGRMG